jgi:hypothetical protein
MPDSVRHLHSVEENLNHRHAELLQAVDKARIVCDEAGEAPGHCPLGSKCNFHLGVGMLGCRCGLDEIEEILKKDG